MLVAKISIKIVSILIIVIDIIIVKIKTSFLATWNTGLNNSFFYYNYNI